MNDAIRYHVRIENPHGHFVQVSMSFVAQADDPVITMPSWTPGSYLLREFGRHVQEVVAVDADGRNLDVAKCEKSSWRVSAREGAAIRVDYAVYAHEHTVRTSHVDGSHAFLSGTSIFMYLEGSVDVAHEVTLEPIDGWTVYTTLPFDGSLYVAGDYDTLVDSPIEWGTGHTVLAFEEEGVPHRLVIWGRGNFDIDKLRADIPRVVRQNAALFGGFPYDQYLFILLLSDTSRGGLEHLDSTALMWQRHRFQGEDYDDFLRLVSHEHFHVWNVKRIRPAALGPFDYKVENYTRALWAMEGVTSYFDKRHLLRAGLITRDRYLTWVAQSIGRLEGSPGRRVDSLEGASFDAWIKLYRPSENLSNASVSYYVKGSLVAMIFDLEIRRATGWKRSYDDVMRLLWERFEDTGAGLPDELFKSAVLEVGTDEMAVWVERYLESTTPIDWERHLAPVGLELRRAGAGTVPYMGIMRRDQGDRVIVSQVLADGPNSGGELYPGDEIAAINGHQATSGSWKNLLKLLPIEGEVEMVVFRRRELMTIRVETVPHSGRPKVVEIEDATDSQIERRERWLGPWRTRAS